MRRQAKFPSPLWEGARGGGICEANIDGAVSLLGRLPHCHARSGMSADRVAERFEDTA